MEGKDPYERGQKRKLGQWVRLVWGWKIGLTITLGALALYILFSQLGFDMISINRQDIAPYATGIWIFSMGTYLAYLEFKYRNHFFILAEDEMIYRSGAFSTERVIIPYVKIQNVVMKRGILNHILNTATLQIETAAGAGGRYEMAEANIPSVPDFEEVAAEIASRMEEARKKAGGRGRF
ncbi:Bacterial PH domain protein [uncultured archaeon]|nr:Bacterial PH domain protein [uncultured archaeon]